MGNQNNIYASLNVCYYDNDGSLEQNKKALNDLGTPAQAFLNVYLSANAAFVSGISLTRSKVA